MGDMLGFAGTSGFPAAVLELDGDVFEVEAQLRPRHEVDHTATHRVLVALAQRDGRAVTALASLGLACADAELALRTGVLAVMRREPPCSPLDPMEIIDLVALASA